MKKSILFVDDNDSLHKILKMYSVKLPEVHQGLSKCIDSAVEEISKNDFDVVFLDNRLCPYEDFRQTMPILRDAGYEGKVVIISNDIDQPEFTEAEEYTCYDCIDKSEIRLNSYADVVSRYL